MPQRSFVFLVVLFLLFSGKISGQGKGFMQWHPGKYDKLLYIEFGNNIRAVENALTGTGMKDIQNKTAFTGIRSMISLSAPVITPSYYCNSLGFFCKKEIQLQKLTSLPVYFRLGTLDYVNYLEQKPNAVKPGN